MRKYRAIFRITLSNVLAYPAELLPRGLMIVMFMWVFHQLWRATYVSSGKVVMNGLTLSDTMWYLMMAETIELARPRLTAAIAEQVKDGSIAYVLNKPYNYLLYHLSHALGESVPAMAANALLAGATVWLLVGPPPPASGWGFALTAVTGAWLLNFCITALIGLAAFVTEEVSPFLWLYQKLGFVLGGVLIPLDFYPAWLQSIARVLPFAYTTYGPARLFVAPEAALLAAVLAGQAVWLLVLGGALSLAYARGIRRLAINGG